MTSFETLQVKNLGIEVRPPWTLRMYFILAFNTFGVISQWGQMREIEGGSSEKKIPRLSNASHDLHTLDIKFLLRCIITRCAGGVHWADSDIELKNKLHIK